VVTSSQVVIGISRKPVRSLIWELNVSNIVIEQTSVANIINYKKQKEVELEPM
jgi:hypothetical protein